MSSIFLPDGTEVFLGNNVPDKMPLSFAEYPESDLLTFEGAMKLITNPKRKRARDVFKFMLNQGSRSSCNAYAATGALRKRRVRDGHKDVELAPEFLYAHINGGRDQGSMLDDGMVGLKEIGVCPRDMVPYQAYLMRDISIEAKRRAKSFRAAACYQIPGTDFNHYWQACISALARGDLLVFAVHVGNSYLKLDRDGCAGVDRGPGNHAVHADDVIVHGNPKTFLDLIFDQAGSWGEKVHDKGRAGIRPEHCREPSRVHATYAIRSTREDDDADNPTVVS